MAARFIYFDQGDFASLQDHPPVPPIMANWSAPIWLAGAQHVHKQIFNSLKRAGL